MAITRFRGEYEFLSNFYPSPISIYGEHFNLGEADVYPDVETYYQSRKTTDAIWKRKIWQSASPAEAKKLGRAAPLRSNWYEIINEIMWRGLQAKFALDQHPELAKRLVATRNEHLEEGNHHGDVYWGTVDGAGENVLGKMLMVIRAQKKRELDPTTRQY